MSHGFSGENTPFLNLSCIYTHHIRYYLHLGGYILSTSKSNRSAHFKHNIALKHNLRLKFFSHPNHNKLKIEELRQIAKDTNSAVIGLSKKKLDETIFASEISIPKYSLIKKPNRKGGGVACNIAKIAKIVLIVKFTYQAKLKVFLLTSIFYFRK